MMKRIAWLILFGVFVSSLFIVDDASAKTINGIPKEYALEINYLIEEGVIEGYPDGGFHAKENVDRAMAATMIGRALPTPLDGKQRDTSFTDVKKGLYASGYIESAYEKEIVLGDGVSKYYPHSSITREQMASVLARAFKLKESGDINYPDVNSKSSIHYKDIIKVSTAGIAEGTGEDFEPKASITREQFSLMVARAMDSSFRIQQEAPDKPAPVVEKMYVTAPSLNVRNEPNGEKIGEFSLNTEVTINSKTGAWYEVTAEKVKGYVHSNYLADQPVKPAPTPNEPPKTNLSKYTVVVDAGHGGKDPGASGNGIVEKNLTLSVSLKVESYLKSKGVNVAMTRTDDSYPTLGQRTDMANKINADIFVSIHGNSFDPSANGSETFHYPGSKDGKALAGFIQTRLVKALDTTDRGVKNENFHILRETKMPSALVELAFMTNKGDAHILKTKQQAAANAVSLGIIDFLNWKDKQ